MRIATIPIEDKTSASRRIRYKAFLKALPKGYSYSKYKGTFDGFQVLYIQKLLRDWTISAAKKAQRKGVAVVLDMDDIRENWSDKPYDKMMRYCDAVTTDTEEKRHELMKHTDLPVFVVPDTIDYGAMEEPPVILRDKITRIATFGRWQNVAAAKDYPGVGLYEERVYICDRKLPGFKDWIFMRWSADTLIDILRDCDLAVLAHHPHWAVNMKSNNRLLVCMAIGLPAVVSDCIAYRSTVEQCGHPELVESNGLNTDRKAVSADFRAHATNYHPSISGRKLAEVFDVVTS